LYIHKNVSIRFSCNLASPAIQLLKSEFPKDSIFAIAFAGGLTGLAAVIFSFRKDCNQLLSFAIKTQQP